MNSAIIPSTLLLTLLLAVGLFFFIKASVKDRTEQVKLIAEQTEESILQQLQEYFAQRAYRVAKVDDRENQVTFEGVVRPSFFLAFFLTLLATAGTLCLALVLSMLIPDRTLVFLCLVLLAPLAGVFYWQKAGRQEQVCLKVEQITQNNNPNASLIIVTAHRDELAELQRVLQLKIFE